MVMVLGTAWVLLACGLQIKLAIDLLLLVCGLLMGLVLLACGLLMGLLIDLLIDLLMNLLLYRCW